MSADARETSVQLGATIPVLRIFDEGKAKEFYVDFLGFKVDWEHRFGEGFPLYMQVSRDGCIMHLSGHHGDACPGSAVRIKTDGLNQFAEALRAKNYKHSRPGCEKTEWGTLETTIADPFGNRLTFAESLSEGGS